MGRYEELSVHTGYKGIVCKCNTKLYSVTALWNPTKRTYFAKSGQLDKF